jgi:trehalose synthase
MPHLQHVPVHALDPHRFRAVVGPQEYADFIALTQRATRRLHGRVIWNVNSTATGGGVVELLGPLLGYSRGSGVDARWVVIRGTPAFFAVTKRLHNHLHGVDGDGAALGATERADYEAALAGGADELSRLVGPRDIVILHDPQTAGLAPAVSATGATTIWRCHVGTDRPNQLARGAWAFLAPYLDFADAFVFSRASYAFEGLAPERVTVIQPSIDAFSPKNAQQDPGQTRAILARAGLAPPRPGDAATFTRSDGTPGRVDRVAELTEAETLDDDVAVVVQVSRWDWLKDPLGVIAAFTQHVASSANAHLVLAGPATTGVGDDPEGAGVYAAVRAAWHELPWELRRRVHLAALPMDDVEENAAIVNALQRRADVIVQKSLAEGFGLTVAEAMWKRRPVVGSGVGGIQDQIVDGASGFLIGDPTDLAAVGAAVTGLLTDPVRAQQIGVAAHERVRERFLAPQHLGAYLALIELLIGSVPATAERSTAGVGPAIARRSPAG